MSLCSHKVPQRDRFFVLKIYSYKSVREKLREINRWIVKSMVCKRNHTQHKKSKLTKLWFSLTRQIYSDSRGKCKDMLEQGSTAVTTALTYQVGGNHRFEKHAINGTKYTFKDGGIGASPNWERPSIWLKQHKNFPLHMHKCLQMPTSKHATVPSDRSSRTKNVIRRYNSTMTLSSCLHTILIHMTAHLRLWPQKHRAFCWTSRLHEKT